MQKFWMVWKHEGKRPKFKHPTIESARIEAERLSIEFPVLEFVILESIETVGPKLTGDAATKWIADNRLAIKASEAAKKPTTLSGILKAKKKA